ncbi:MAG: hypothetical protein UT23_C0005G0040 [Candidatus Woesebacteria bacterium GW2011_GWA1_39_12]|uniref:Alpha-(1->3)-arabinofuranosyltransferase N-terminal GT-C domain-containing protein n=1 Tax=Candidatus Woesebacteria bacterium GW2011_GWA1_39_12 TaxID=1618549 RepID=A0A0G0M4B5_9BACT|nr:MAG: hypothetical protein UT23_C0005G0040 [Candidatus Woesebacteria bacterium GW2011_GWA1_39_12]
MKRTLLLFFVISIFLTLQWFKSGKFIATGEEGLTIYNPSRTLELYNSVWYETGTGAPSPVYLPRVTFFAALSFGSQFLDGYKLQAFVYFVFLFLGLFGTFLLVKYLTQSVETSFISALFYLFNLYVQSQIWNRYLYASITLWVFLPFFLYFLIVWLVEKKTIFLLFFILTGFFASNSYGHPALLINLWFSALLFLIIILLFNVRNKKVIKNYLGRFSAAFVIWILTNLWWIYPYVKIAGASFSEISDWSANFSSLTGVSKSFPALQILFLRQASFFGVDGPWYPFYQSVVIWVISILILAVVAIGIFTSRKNKYFLFLIELLLIGLFLNKGSNPPFGYTFYKSLFSYLPFTAILRNPYEKLGLLFVLPYSIFFGYGINWLYTKTKKPFGTVVASLALVICCGILVLPMWTGKVYGKSVRVEVPDYYNQTNDYLKERMGDGRILVLPIIPGDGVKYTWGYQGIEPSEFLFDRPSISKVLRAQYFDDKYMNLYAEFVSQKDYDENLKQMNISHIVLHHDQDEEVSSASSSAEVKETLTENENTSFLKDIGELSIYEFVPNKEGYIFVIKDDEKPTLIYSKISSTQYAVEIKDAKKPYILIFKSTYNKLWQAKIEGEIQKEHFVVYDYANAWRINKIGDYTIKVDLKIWPWD